MGINQGDIYWVQVEDLSGSEPGIRHPHVVIQENILNHSRITTVVACALTSNRKRANTPGNVLLEVGEANLPTQSVVEVSKVSAALPPDAPSQGGVRSQWSFSTLVCFELAPI